LAVGGQHGRFAERAREFGSFARKPVGGAPRSERVIGHVERGRHLGEAHPGFEIAGIVCHARAQGPREFHELRVLVGAFGLLFGERHAGGTGCAPVDVERERRSRNRDRQRRRKQARAAGMRGLDRRFARQRQHAAADFRASGLGFARVDGAARQIARDLFELVAMHLHVEGGARRRGFRLAQHRPHQHADDDRRQASKNGENHFRSSGASSFARRRSSSALNAAISEAGRGRRLRT
jgi:hypothetical protein